MIRMEYQLGEIIQLSQNIRWPSTNELTPSNPRQLKVLIIISDTINVDMKESDAIKTERHEKRLAYFGAALLLLKRCAEISKKCANHDTSTPVVEVTLPVYL